jgi:hypothetical protein
LLIEDIFGKIQTMMNILPKKLLSLLLAAIIATQFLVLPVMAQNGLGSDGNVSGQATKLQEAKSNYNIVKAYAEYEKNPSDAKAQQTLTQALTSAHYTGPAITENTTDTKAAINGLMGEYNKVYTNNPPYTPITDTATTLKTAEQNVKTRQSEYEVVLGTKNSNELVNNAGDKKAVAESVYRYQSIERMQKLNCIKTDDKSQPEPSSLCVQLITEYNGRCPSGDTNCPITVPAEKAYVETQDFTDARKAAITNVQNVESTLQQKFKETMLGQKLEVSDILTYESGDAKQTDYITEGGIVYFISRVVDSLVIAVSSLAVVALIIGGYMLITSGGDEQKRENGKSAIKYTIIGLFFVFGSYAIVSLIIGLLYSV